MVLGALLLLVLLLLFILLLLSILLLLILLLLRVLLGTASVTARCLRGAAPCGSSHLLVVSLVLCQDLFPHFLLSLVDVRIELVPVLSDRELLVIVNWDKDFLSADWFFVWVVELGHVRVLQCLLSRQSLSWVEL